MGTTITSYFKAFHTANESPSEIGGRKTTLSELSGMVDRFHTLSAQLDKQSDTINATIGDETDRVNSLLNSINDLNQAIVRTQGSPEENLMLFDQRDEAIRQLSEKMEIRTVTQPNGSMLVNMSTGHSLVLDGGVAQFKVVPGIRIPVSLPAADPGQEPGQHQRPGYWRCHRWPLHRAPGSGARQAGAGAAGRRPGDAMNQQNRLGMDLDNELGGSLHPQREPGAALRQQPGQRGGQRQLRPRQGSEVTTFDYEVRFNSATGYEVFAIDGSGQRTSLATGTTPPATFEVAGHGIEIDLSGTPVAGDKILLQPTRNAAANLDQAITRPEDIALASPEGGQGIPEPGLGRDNAGRCLHNTGTGSGFGTNTWTRVPPGHQDRRQRQLRGL